MRNMFTNNFKKSMRDFANPWRIFALNGEGGAIISDYPKGSRKPAIPIPYCEESMHGFEYQLAGLMISEGMIDEGLTLVRAVRDRYDGEKRNPWNEIECGSNYARSMASFALIPIFSGFKFDLPKGKIRFNPLVRRENFKCFWAAVKNFPGYSVVTDLSGIERSARDEAAVICSTDYHALQVVRKRNGNTKGIIGFDNISILDLCDIQIDSVSYSVADIANYAVEIIVKASKQSAVAPHAIVKRGSI